MGKFTIEGVAVDELPWRPCIYGPLPRTSCNAPDRYGLAVPVALVHPATACWIAGGEKGHFKVSSLSRPTVWQGSLKALVQSLAELDAQNRPRDEFFEGKTLRVRLETVGLPTSVCDRRYEGRPMCHLVVHGVEVM